jgi:aminomethyltransferase
MGRFYFEGNGIDRFLDKLTTRRVAGVEPGKIRYSLMTNESGRILDDVLVYHLERPGGSSQHMMVVNAGNRSKIFNWITDHLEGTGITLDDRTLDTAMIAVQGPKACSVVSQISDLDPATLPYYTGAYSKVLGHEALISRTGYTGEDGCEVIVSRDVAVEVATAIADRSSHVGGRPVGLGARDTLRLEAAMPLYGHELTEAINAAQTDLGFAINLKDRDFVGRSAIVAAKKDSNLPVRVGLELEGKRAAREECSVLVNGQNVGFVTSGTFAPTLQKAISMAYVAPEFAAVGTSVEIDIRGKATPARVVRLPFYSRT